MTQARLYTLLADLTVVMHAGFVLFVVGGQLAILAGWARRWRWTRDPVFRVAHLIAIGFVVLEAWCGIVCPLTVLEKALRGLAGVPVYEGSFIGYWVHRLLFYQGPGWVFTLVHSLFGAAVVVSFVAYPPRWRRRGA
jgi:polyferredoxin